MKILLLAGEESGMIYARGLRERLAGHEIRGYQDYGFETADLAVVGFGAVLRKIFFFLRVKHTIERAIDEWRPDAVCTIDYPGLNLKIAAYAKAHGIRTVHVVCPQVWAWRQGRIPKIEASLDKLCCFFPFEPKIFRPGLAEFVGHPLVQDFERDMSCARDTADESGRRTVAVLPGSRKVEIARILPTLLKAADMLNRKDVDFVIPAANDKAFELIEKTLAGQEVRSTFRVRHGGARALLMQATCAVVASGTATLEAALARCPTVLVYRVSPLLAAFLRRAVTGTKYAGLANIIWQRCDGKGATPPMPELLQEALTPEAVAEWLDKWLTDEPAREDAAKRLGDTVAKLADDGDPLTKIAQAVIG